MTGLFRRRNLRDYADSLAAYVPDGPLFASKSIEGSNLRMLLRGLSSEFFRVNGALIEYNTEILPDRTTKFLDEWESAVGIPDACFLAEGTEDERRRDILLKLASLGIQTLEDFQSLADVFDITATVLPGEESPSPISFPKFTIVVEWVGVTPEQSAQINTLRCLFQSLKPANVQLLLFNDNFFAQCGEAAMECGEPFAECGNSVF